MQIEYSENMDVAYFDGLKFRREKTTGYYLNSARPPREENLVLMTRKEYAQYAAKNISLINIRSLVVAQGNARAY